MVLSIHPCNRMQARFAHAGIRLISMVPGTGGATVIAPKSSP
jgi:hypothetical protein